MEKYYTAGQATDDNIIRLMRFACWVTKTRNTHSDYVTLLFHYQKWLRESAPILRYTCIVSPAGIIFSSCCFCLFSRVTSPELYFIRNRYLFDLVKYILDHHTTNKCTNCMSFILNHFFKTLSLLLKVSISYRLSSSGSTVHLPPCTRNNVHNYRICCHNNIIKKKFIFLTYDFS